jgi:HK97 family phage major capsid protein
MYKSVEEVEARRAEIKERLQSINTDHAGATFPDEIKEEWNKLVEERDALKDLSEELSTRDLLIESMAENEDATERSGAHFNAPRRRVENIYDLVEIRRASTSLEHEGELLRDNAMRALEQSYFPHPDASDSRTRDHVGGLIDRFSHSDREEQDASALCRRILATGSRVYQRAFGKMMMGIPTSPEEQRALGIAGASGGFAVPFNLDPTIIPTSNLSVNPFRAIANVKQITGTTWQGVSSAGVTATYTPEGTEATDAAPTLVQPTATPVKCQVTIPFSIEVGADWGTMQQDVAVLIQDAKDDVEATKFTSGSGTNEPQGVVTGATNLVTTAGTAAFVVADLYSLQAALPPRFRPRSQFVGNLATYNAVRAFDTGGGGALWVQLQSPVASEGVATPGNIPPLLLGRPAWEDSALAATPTTSASKTLVFGDWRYFAVVDRIGMNVEVVPHLFGQTNRLPVGQRAIYAYWRNTSVVISAAAFRVLIVR